MSPSTEPAQPEADFATGVLAELLHEIEFRNANQNPLSGNVFHVSHAWTDGPALFVVYTAPPSDRIWGLARDTRQSLIDPGPWNPDDHASLYYYLLDFEENWPGNFSREPGEAEMIWWKGDPRDDLIKRAADIPASHRYTRPAVDPAWIRREPPVINEPRRYADPNGPRPPLPDVQKS